MEYMYRREVKRMEKNKMWRETITKKCRGDENMCAEKTSVRIKGRGKDKIYRRNYMTYKWTKGKEKIGKRKTKKVKKTTRGKHKGSKRTYITKCGETARSVFMFVVVAYIFFL